MSARVEIYTDAKGEHRWRAWSNGHIMADSGEGYSTRSNARRAWRRFQRLVWALEVRERAS